MPNLTLTALARLSVSFSVLCAAGALVLGVRL